MMVLSMLMLPLAFQRPASAATANPTTGSPGYEVMTFHLTGALTGGALAGIVKFNMPWPAQFLGVQAVTRAHTGAQTVNVLNAGTSMLASVMTLNTAGIVVEGTLSTTASALRIADEAAVTIDFNTGTSATDTTIILILKRR
jgi:hypothetical protein